MATGQSPFIVSYKEPILFPMTPGSPPTQNQIWIAIVIIVILVIANLLYGYYGNSSCKVLGLSCAYFVAAGVAIWGTTKVMQMTAFKNASQASVPSAATITAPPA